MFASCFKFSCFLFALCKTLNQSPGKVQAKAASSICACPANAPVLEAVKELSSLYFKEGNANAGKLYLPR